MEDSTKKYIVAGVAVAVGVGVGYYMLSKQGSRHHSDVVVENEKETALEVENRALGGQPASSAANAAPPSGTRQRPPPIAFVAPEATYESDAEATTTPTRTTPTPILPPVGVEAAVVEEEENVFEQFMDAGDAVELQFTKGFEGTFSFSLSAMGVHLKEAVAHKAGIPLEGMKLVWRGKFLKDDQPLEQQGVKANASFLVMARASSAVPSDPAPESTDDTVGTEGTASRSEQHVDDVRRVVRDIAARTDVGDDTYHFFEAEDQFGHKHSVPPSFIAGTLLYHYGKEELKEQKPKEALVYFRAAEQEFHQCDAMWLNLTSNYAQLCLDLVWVFYLLQDEHNLREATTRLNIASRKFMPLMQAAMSNLHQIGPCPDLAIFMRLALLNGVVALYSGDTDTSQRGFAQAELLLGILKVDEGAVEQLMEISSCERKEAVRAMRAARGSVDGAFMYILEQKEKESQIEEQRQVDRLRSREQRRAGKTASGAWIDLDLLAQIVEAVPDRKLAVEALRQTDNNLEQAISLCLDNPQVLYNALSPTPTGTAAFPEGAETTGEGESEGESAGEGEGEDGEGEDGEDDDPLGLANLSPEIAARLLADKQIERTIVQIMGDAEQGIEGTLDGEFEEEMEVLRKFT